MRFKTGIVTIVILSLILLSLTTGANNKNTNAYTDEEFLNLTTNLNNSVVVESFAYSDNLMMNIYFKFLDFITYSFIETMKYFLLIGFNNPQYDYNLLFNILKYIMCGYVAFLVIRTLKDFLIIVRGRKR